MKKRITCFLLALLMVLSILPPQTFATDVETTSEGQSVVECYATVKSTFSGYAYGTPGVFSSGVICSASYFPELLIITDVQNVDGTDYYQLSAAKGSWKYGLSDGIWMKAEYIDVQLPEEPDAPTDPSETTDPSTPTEPSDPVDPNAPSISATVTDANGNPVLDANGNPQTVTVSGDALPEGATLRVSVGTQAQMDAFGGPSEDYNLYVYNIELVKDGASVQPNGKVKVTISNVELFENGYVNVIHILDDADAIRNGIAESTAFPLDESPIVNAFPAEAVLAEEVAGESGVVYIEEFSTDDDNVMVSLENNSISVYLTSFSTIAAANGNITVSGTSTSMGDGTDIDRYVLPGSTLTFSRNANRTHWRLSTTSSGVTGSVASSDNFNLGTSYEADSWTISAHTATVTINVARTASGTTTLYSKRGIGNGGNESKVDIIVVTDAVSYNANGGTGTPGSQTKYHNENLTLSATRPTRTNYTFTGWHSSADNKIYQPGETYSLNQATVMTAQWNYNVQIADGYDGYLNPAGPALPSGYSYRWSKRSGTYSYDVTTWSNSWSAVSSSNMNGNAVDVLKDGGYVSENAEMNGGTKYQYRLEAVSGSTVIGTAYYTVNYGTQILNSSFEIPSISKYDNHVFYWNDHENLFWKSTATKELAPNGHLEIGNNTRTFYNEKQAVHGEQFAELNADMAAALYQDVFTEPNKNLTWAINHSARVTEGEDEMYVIITSSKAASNITTQVQIDEVVAKAEELAASYTAAGNDVAAAGVFSGEYDVTYNGINFRIWRCVSQFVSKETWTKYAGQYQVPSNQKMTRFFFSAGQTATGDRTIGNLLDAVYFDDSIHYVINYYINGELIPALSEEGVKGPGDVVKATKVGTLTANDATYFSAIYLNNTQQAMVAEPSITMDASRGNVLNLYFISQHKVTLDQTDATTPSNVTQYYYRFNTTQNSSDGKLIYYYTERACTNPMVNGTGETKYYSITPPQRTGYTFGGYFTEQNGQGTKYIDENGMCVNNIWQNVAADSTLYAYWIPQYQYALIFDANGTNVTGMPANQNVDWIDGATKTFNWTQEPTRTGYAFQGWAESANATTGSKTKSITVTGSAAGKATKTLYAIWLPVYTVKGEIDNGGTITVADGGTNPQSVVSGQNNKTITFTPATGYVIIGVKVNGNSVTEFSPSTFSFTQRIDENTTVVVTTRKNVFTITWKDDNGRTIDTTKVEYGKVPTHTDPSKAPTAEYTYTFAGWTPAIVAATQDATYTATYSATKNYYTVTFANEDGTVLSEKQYVYGTKAADIVKPTNPQKASTAEFSYTFAGWTPQIADVTGDATYKATYTSNTRSYTITWVDGDGKTLHTETWAYNTMPQYTGSKTPTKTATAQYTYTFNNKWSPEITKVTGDATYTAQFDATVNKYMITWVDGDGNTLKTEQVEYGKTPVYSGEKPTKTATDQYTYIFNDKWSPEITKVTGNATYTAQFDATVNKYTIIWVDGDGNTLKTEEVPYGDTPAYTGATPTKTATAQYSYTWDNTWSPAIVSVTGDATYTAQFTQSVRTYTVTWKNWDDTVLKTDTVAYNLKLTYNGTKPSRAETQQYWYNFEGWNGSDGSQIDAYEEITVTGDITYTAILNPKLMKYYVTWVVEGVEKDKDLWEYGDTPTYSGETPTKAEDDGYTYQWKGEWTPVVVPVVDTVTYEAIFKESVKIFSITYDLDGGALPAGKNNPASYHVETETFPLNEPERTGYTFTGWTGSYGDTPQTSVSVVTGTTGNLTFTANWQAKNVGYKVVHWKQTIGGGSEHNETNFPYKEIENLTAEADSKVKPTVKNYEGFTAPIEVEVTIAADGSTVVNYYYTRNTYTIHFNANAGTGTMDSLTLAYDQSMKLTANAFARKGYSFKGWATAADGGIVYADQKEVKNLSVQNGAHIDLYAVWEINLFNLIIKTNNGVDENQSYIFTVSGTGYDGTEIRLQVALGANDEQKIVGVPAGIYTVADQNGWSWRYEHQEIKDREVVTDQVADFNYTYSRMKDTKIYWLNGYGNDLLQMSDNKRKK